MIEHSFKILASEEKATTTTINQLTEEGMCNVEKNKGYQLKLFPLQEGKEIAGSS